MRDARAQLIEIAALDRTERIGDALKLDILGRVAADRRRCAPGVAVNTFEAGPVALVPEAGKPDAGLLARPAAEEAYLDRVRSEEHTSELQSLMRISYAVFCLKKKKNIQVNNNQNTINSTTKKKTYK